jgi:hypothetical protein
MGAWGPGIFADDEAADVRDNFKLYVADNQDVAAATDAIASDHGASVDAPEHNTAFWLGLALTQWNAGWLDPRVQRAAFRVIDDGSDLAKWEDSQQRSRRAAALRAARERLDSTPPKPKPFPRPWPTQLADFQIGEIIGRQLPNGRLAVMKVIGFRPTHIFKVRGPAVRLQHWLRQEMPTEAEARDLEFLRHPLSPRKTTTMGSLVLTAPRSAPLDPDLFIRPGIIVPVSEREAKTSYGSVSAHTCGTDEVFMTALERFWEDPDLPATALPPWCDPAKTASRRN